MKIQVVGEKPKMRVNVHPACEDTSPGGRRAGRMIQCAALLVFITSNPGGSSNVNGGMTKYRGENNAAVCY